MTSSLLYWENDNKTTIFAIQALDYTVENKHWFTIKIDREELQQRISDFKLLD